MTLPVLDRYASGCVTGRLSSNLARRRDINIKSKNESLGRKKD